MRQNYTGSFQFAFEYNLYSADLKPSDQNLEAYQNPNVRKNSLMEDFKKSPYDKNTRKTILDAFENIQDDDERYRFLLMLEENNLFIENRELIYKGAPQNSYNS